MHTVTELLRSHVLDTAGYFVPTPVPSLESLQQTEWFPEFEQLMRRRMIMGAFRYGLLVQKWRQNYRMFAYLKQKVESYEQTGNKEFLVDIANMAALEFLYPSHPKAHWAPEDDREHCATGV